MRGPTISDTPVPPLTRQPDFFPFWRDTLDALAAVPHAAALEEQGVDQQLCLSRLEFASSDGVRLSGYLNGWRDPRPRPLLVFTHGYNGRIQTVPQWARAGFHVLGFDVRGCGDSRRGAPKIAADGYILTGIEDQGRSILRGAVCDFIRAAEVGRTLLDERISRVVFYGFSFAGALCMMAQALTGMADFLAVGVPTFGWMEGRRRLVRRGSGAEVNDFLAANPEREASVMRVLSYFDTMNFADRIGCPTLVGLGERDDIVPAATVQAIVNRLRCPYRLRRFPHSHSAHPSEARWAEFEEEWLTLALTAGYEDFETAEVALG
jgi:cephalosporin-C deacetylase